MNCEEARHTERKIAFHVRHFWICVSTPVWRHRFTMFSCSPLQLKSSFVLAGKQHCLVYQILMMCICWLQIQTLAISSAYKHRFGFTIARLIRTNGVCVQYGQYHSHWAVWSLPSTPHRQTDIRFSNMKIVYLKVLLIIHRFLRCMLYV